MSCIGLRWMGLEFESLLFPLFFATFSLSRTQKTHEKHTSFAIRGKKGVFVFLSRDKERVPFVSFTFVFHGMVAI